MTPATILTAVRMGVYALDKQHAVVIGLWAKFGAAVRRVRIQRRVSPRRLASHLGISPAMLGMMETGKRVWQMDRAEKAVRFFSRPEQWPDQGRAKS